MVPYRSLKNWEPVTGMVKWVNPRRKKSAYINLPMEFILDEESGARALGPSVVPYLLRHLWPSFWGHIAMRASFLLDPLLLDPRIPIFTDSPSTWIAPPMGDWVSRHLWSSSSKSGFPYTWDNRQHHSPVARIPIRKCCNGICCRSGTRVPMHHFYKRGVVAAMDKKGGIGQSITSIGWRHQWIAGSHGQVHMGWATIFVPKVLSRKWADPSSWFARILLQLMNDLELDGMKLSYK